MRTRAKSFKDTAAFNQRAESSFILLTTAHLAVANRANAWDLGAGLCQSRNLP